MADFRAKIKAELDTTNLGRELKNLENGNHKIKIGVDTGDTKKGVEDVDKQLRTSKKTASSFGDSLKSALNIGGAAALAAKGIQTIGDAAKQAVSSVKEIDTAIKDLRMATGESYSTVQNMVQSYNQMGQSLGATTTEMTSAADAWLRQGKSISETNELIKDSMMLSKIAGLDAADSTQYLTSAMKGYKIAVSDVSGIVDKLTAVDLVSATDAGGLAEAMSRVAVTADTAGVSMDRLLGYLATTGEVTQRSMSSIGEAYKTIFTRMSDIKSGKLKLIDDDGTEEMLSDVEQTLANVGIDLRKTVTEYNDYQDVLDNLAAKWSSLSQVQQNALSKAFAGTRQAEYFRVLMENYDSAKKYADVAANSAGSAEQKFGAYLDSIEAKSKSLQAAFESLAVNTFSTGLVGGIIDASTAVIEFLDKTNLLKGALAGLAVTGAIKGFTLLKTGIMQAATGMNAFHTAMSLLDTGSLGEEAFEKLILLTGNLSKTQLKAVVSAESLSTAQRMAILTSTGMTKSEASATLASMGLATAEGAATGATFSLAGAFKGLWATLMANPLILIVAGITAAAVAAYKFANAFDDAKDAASDSAGVYASTKSEIESLNSELETTSSRIEELQAQGTLSLSDEAELAKLQRQSAELQNQINLKQRLAEIQSEQSVKDTMDALTVRSSQSKSASENTIYMTGQYTGTNSDKYTDIVTATELDVRRLRELKEENNKLYEDWKVAPESGKDEIQKWIDENEKEIDKYEETISERMADISELGENLENASSLDSSAQKMLDRIHQLSTAYSSIDLSSVEQNFSALESYFSSSSNSFLKDFITDAVASGEKATDVIGQLGLSLSQIGLPEDAGNDLNKYFQDLAKSASEAENAVDEIDSSLSGIEKASESQNAGDNFDKYLSYIDNARRYYAQGKTGIDDFKTVAASLNNNSQDAEENLKQFKGNLDKIKKYLTVDTNSKLTQSSSTSNVDGNIKSSITLDDGQLTVTKQNMLDLADAFEVARKKAASTGTEFKSTAELAEALDVPIDFLEYAMDKMQDYNISTAFDDLPKASENLAEAKDGLSQLQEIYDSMSDSDSKEFLGKQIEGFQKQIDEANGDLSKLDTDIVCQLKLEYDLAYLQSVIDDAEARIAAGGGSEDYVTAIAAQSKQIGLLNETTHLDKIEAPIEYRATEGSIAALKEQLKGITNEEQKIRVQAEIKSLQQAQLDVMGAFQNAHPEITAETDVDTAKETFDKWLDEENGKELVINAATQMDESVKKLIDGGDIEVDAFVDYILGEQADPELKEAAVDYFTGEQQDPDPKIAEMFYKLAQQDPANPWYPLLYYVYGGQAPAKDDKNHSVYYRYGSQAPAKNSYDGDVFYGYGGQDDPEDRNAKVYYTAVFKNAGIKPVQANIPDGSRFNGTAHAQGTAYASGNWGLKRDEYALINELGAEAIIRGSKYYIFNNGFPTFAKLKKGDIVFNNKQTEELMLYNFS